ncbi:MAG: phosphoglycerate mutase family protein [Gemmatimonadaceae bacterium]
MTSSWNVLFNNLPEIYMRVSRLLLQWTMLALVTTLGARATFAQNVPAMVIVVRHAEKATVGGADPSLSDVGQARAKALATALADAGVTAVITTTYKRTFETSDVVAMARNITTEKVAIAGGTPAHVESIVSAVKKHPGEVVLVVGHSNTVPAIVTALGGPKMPDLCDANYATMFIVHMATNGKPAQVVRTRYGAAEADGAETCTTPMK